MNQLLGALGQKKGKVTQAIHLPQVNMPSAEVATRPSLMPDQPPGGSLNYSRGVV